MDTAAQYGNERQVGEGIRRSGVQRSMIVVETKLWISDFGYDQTLSGFDKSARKLGLEQIDLLILHHPAPQRFDQTLQAYRALEKLLADQRVRAIGVSNFTAEHLRRLIARTAIVPAVNQVELHPYFSQPGLREVHAQHGIITQAWSPIGGITFYPGWGADRRNVMRDPVIARIAHVHGRSPAQIMLRWHIQQGRSAIPKSVDPQRIAENLNIFDFALSEKELADIDDLDTGRRTGPDPDAQIPEDVLELSIPDD
ncbi:aldo/keto reductase [Kineosporia babensis]|uniref:Aldo/keto reductase n=1 Tax=Kineosporia babensis TaxID=499548 RepID=A0A9X1NNK2_9ACTN|nr:aldo/keto reductase [Kineosporia babensis]